LGGTNAQSADYSAMLSVVTVATLWFMDPLKHLDHNKEDRNNDLSNEDEPPRS